MLNQTKDYNSLIPPENPDYPWAPKDWQPLCYYCNQPVKLTKPYAGTRQRVIYGWEHMFPVPESCENKWKRGSTWHCDPAKVRPTTEIDEPRCHICGTQTTEHGMVCSAAGKPPYHATTLSQKEEELTRRFGWTSVSEMEVVKQERERVSATEAIGALAITGVVLGLLAWVTGSLPFRRQPLNK
jgi:hypothetical protein